MTKRKVVKQEKSPNGEGNYPGIFISFDLADENDARAYNKGMELAARRQRTPFIKGALLMLDKIEKELGAPVNTDALLAELAAAILTRGSGGGGSPGGNTPSIQIVNAERADAEEVFNNIAEQFGDLFGDEE